MSVVQYLFMAISVHYAVKWLSLRCVCVMCACFNFTTAPLHSGGSTGSTSVGGVSVAAVMSDKLKEKLLATS